MAENKRPTSPDNRDNEIPSWQPTYDGVPGLSHEDMAHIEKEGLLEEFRKAGWDAIKKNLAYDNAKWWKEHREKSLRAHTHEHEQERVRKEERDHSRER